MGVTIMSETRGLSVLSSPACEITFLSLFNEPVSELSILHLWSFLIF